MTVKGQIEETKIAKSGKTLGVRVNGKWYRTKEFHLEHEVGSIIDFDVTTSSLPDGKPLFWIGDYHIEGHSVMPPPDVPRETAPTAIPPGSVRHIPSTNDVELLDFIGRCFAGYPFQTTDEVAVRSRARMLYLLGKDILSGKIEDVETGPRKKREAPPEAGIPGYSPTLPHNENDPDSEDPDDDFPF
jgi:hypothetical protein